MDIAREALNAGNFTRKTKKTDKKTVYARATAVAMQCVSTSTSEHSIPHPSIGYRVSWVRMHRSDVCAVHCVSRSMSTSALSILKFNFTRRMLQRYLGVCLGYTIRGTPSPVAHTLCSVSAVCCCAALLRVTMREELARLLDGLTGTVRFDNADPRWVACMLADCHTASVPFCENRIVACDFYLFFKTFCLDLRRKTVMRCDTASTGFTACLVSLRVVV